MLESEGSQSEELQQEAELRDFRLEIAELKAREERKELPTVHLIEVDPTELNEEDRKIWRGIQDGTLTPDTLRAYSATFRDEKGKQRENIPRSRHEFLEFVNNKATILFGRHRREQEKKQQ